MKVKVRLLITFLCFILLCCLPFGFAYADEEITAEDILQYDGLSARLREDYPGIRSIYTANHTAIDALIAKGYTVEYGAVMAAATSDGYSARDISVTYNKDSGYTATGAASAICVYSSKGSAYASNLYISETASVRRFAYTTTYQAANESKAYYELGLVYAGFVAITAPDADAPVISYIYAEGDVFGKTEARYGLSTSVMELIFRTNPPHTSVSHFGIILCLRIIII